MRKLSKRFAITSLAALCMIGSSLFFNSLAIGGEGCGHGHWGHHGHHHFLAKMLNLTDNQKKEIFSIRLDERAKMKPMFESLKEGHKQLAALVKSDKFDEAKAQSIAKGQAAILANIIVEKARMRSRMYAVLTPEQRTKLEQIHKSWKDRHEKMLKNGH